MEDEIVNKIDLLTFSTIPFALLINSFERKIRCTNLIYWSFIFVSVFATTSVLGASTGNTIVCEKKGNCICQMADGSGTIDLTSLAELAPGQDAVFSNVTGTDLNLYSFKPCVGFTERYSKHVCENVAVCEYDRKNSKYLNLGSPDSVVFKAIATNNSTVTMVYTVGSGSSQITTNIKLQCSDTNKLSVIGAANKNLREMVLSSKCACLDGCLNRLSVGSVLLITLTFLTATYLLVGCLYNKTVYNSSGCELIPNYTFWSELPSLIKDGYLFFISPCLGDRVEYRYYERL
ncbi:uncharacterized protein LOC141908823 [Tubulanus polymorphus]|uniref:uncharacterized protein LOC141908823 n=1 Tax=Tubulanus polymorphus TaxID=672921 RepID=UPI003DA1EC5F